MTDDERRYRELVASEERLQAFMRHSPALAFMKDAEGRYVYVNSRMEDTFGIQLADIKGKADADWLPEAVARTARQSDQLVLETGDAIETVETIPTTDGEDRHWMVLKFPFPQADGQRFVGGVAIDITARLERLSESERRYRRVFESGLGLMCTHDLEGRLLTVNAAAATSAGYSPDELVGTLLPDHLTPEARPLFPAYLDRIREGGTDAGLMLIVAKDGRIRTWKYHNALVSELGTADYVLGHAQDVTELKQAQEEAKNLSLADDLTALHNRRGFLTLASQHLKLAPRNKRGLLLSYADIDGLKAINDQYGHEEGSKAIVHVSEVLQRSFRDTDIIARLGGDEFVALHINASDEDAGTIRRRLAETLAEYNHQRDHPFELSLSVGIAVVAHDNTRSIDELLQLADEAMYEEKRRKHRENV